MMAALDLAVFKVVRALETTEFDHNTLVFFTSDNGGDSTQGSSNWPLRGSKGSVWEGDIRVPSFIWRSGKGKVWTLLLLMFLHLSVLCWWRWSF